MGSNGEGMCDGASGCDKMQSWTAGNGGSMCDRMSGCHKSVVQDGQEGHSVILIPAHKLNTGRSRKGHIKRAYNTTYIKMNRTIERRERKWKTQSFRAGLRR
ncbi:MAG TPA: hypothetical protein DCZ91_07580 [Lachnospiraceae bacterium]|nr:hypothetical protein [Lachnospiraceae bacterium]